MDPPPSRPEPHRPELLTSTLPRCGLHFLVRSPWDGALRTSAPGPRSLLPALLQLLLPGVTQRRGHVKGRGRALRPGAPCRPRLLFCFLSLARRLWMGGPAQTTLPARRFSECLGLSRT